MQLDWNRQLEFQHLPGIHFSEHEREHSRLCSEGCTLAAHSHLTRHRRSQTRRYSAPPPLIMYTSRCGNGIEIPSVSKRVLTSWVSEAAVSTTPPTAPPP